MLLLIIIIAAVAIFVGIKISKNAPTEAPKAEYKVEPTVVKTEEAPKATKKTTQAAKKPKQQKQLKSKIKYGKNQFKII